jgi:hypothetical protein
MSEHGVPSGSQVRGETYLEDSAKVVPRTSAFELVHMEGFRYPGQLFHIVDDPRSFVHHAATSRADTEWLVVVYQVPKRAIGGAGEDPELRFHVAM